MKVRSSFVTNSSSSSFVLARKGELTEKQKDALIKVIEDEILGRAQLTPEDSEEKVKKEISEDWSLEENEEAVRKALSEGKTIYSGSVCFEEAEYSYMEIFLRIWDILEKNSEDNNFEVIEGSLDY